MGIADAPAVKCWHVTDWPEIDQRAWRRNIIAGDPFTDDGDPSENYGADLSPYSLEKVRKGYGRFLSFLASRGWLVPELAPLERVTVGRLNAYCRNLLRQGNQRSTVVGRFTELTMAMRILAPGRDVNWIRKPSGITIYSLLPRTQRKIRVPPCEVLFDWGIAMMRRAESKATELQGQLAYRDGLLIALLAARGRRRRSMSLLTVGNEIFKDGDHYRIELGRTQVKTRKPDRFDIRQDLTPHIDFYLAVIRPELLGGHDHRSLWVSRAGRPLTAKGLAERVRVLSLKRFGYSFGPHSFRHSISTMLAEDDPQNAGLAGAVLGISPEVNMAHYNRAQQDKALNKLASLIERRSAAAAKILRS